jgi:hypothetical protein
MTGALNPPTPPTSAPTSSAPYIRTGALAHYYTSAPAHWRRTTAHWRTDQSHPTFEPTQNDRPAAIVPVEAPGHVTRVIRGRCAAHEGSAPRPQGSILAGPGCAPGVRRAAFVQVRGPILGVSVLPVLVGGSAAATVLPAPTGRLREAGSLVMYVTDRDAL